MNTTRSGRLARYAGAGIGLVALGASLFSVGASAEQEDFYSDQRPGEDRTGIRATDPWVKLLTNGNYSNNGWTDASLGGGSVEFSEAHGGTRAQPGTTQAAGTAGALVLSQAEATTAGDSLASFNWVLDNGSQGYGEDPVFGGFDAQTRLESIRHLQYDMRTDAGYEDVQLKLELRNNDYEGLASEYTTAIYFPAQDDAFTGAAATTAAGWETFDATSAGKAWMMTGSGLCGTSPGTAHCSFDQVVDQMGGDSIVVSIQFGMGTTNYTGPARVGAVDNFIYRIGSDNTGDYKAWNMEQVRYPALVDTSGVQAGVLEILNEGMTVTMTGAFDYGTVDGSPVTDFLVKLVDDSNVPIIGTKINLFRVEPIPGLPRTLLCSGDTDANGIATCDYDGAMDATLADITVRAVWAEQNRPAGYSGPYVVDGTTVPVAYGTL